MRRTAHEMQRAAVRRARLLGRLAPLVALAAASLTYGLHHLPPLDAHGPRMSLVVVVATAALVAIVPVLVARGAERQLPLVVALRPETGGSVRAAEAGDLDFCAALHAEQLPHGFFVALGHRFLRAYLATFLSSPHAVGLLVSAREAPVGMVFGIVRPRAHARWVLRRHGPRFVALGAMAMLTRPRIATRFVSTRLQRYRRAWRRRSDPVAAEPAEQQPAVLSHVAVTPGAQGAGLGGQLVRAFVDAARAEGCSRVILTTQDGPDGAAGFYRREGWFEEERRDDFDGQGLIVFSLELREPRR